MADLKSVSQIVDGIRYDAKVYRKHDQNPARSKKENGACVIDTKGLRFGTAAAEDVNCHARDEKKTVNHQKVTWKSFSRLGGSGSVLKKCLSEPEFRNHTYFLNEAFEGDIVYNRNRRRSTFIDIVNEVTRTQIKEDIHPYGRGHLYKNVIEKDRPTIHKDEEKLLMWVVATILILGIAAGVIVMSQMYNANHTTTNTTTLTGT